MATDHNPTCIEVHGNYYYGRGSVSFEIYNNTINSGHSFMGMYIRGGTGVIFNNTFLNDFTYPIVFANYQSFTSGTNHPPGPCGYACCTYPCPDQINQAYVWDNTYGGSPVDVFVRDRGLERDHIQEGRDYFMYEKPGYTPFEYPHPLTATVGSPPSVPSNLRTE